MIDDVVEAVVPVARPEEPEVHALAAKANVTTADRRRRRVRIGVTLRPRCEEMVTPRPGTGDAPAPAQR